MKRTPKTPESCLAAARRLAAKSGMYVVAKSDCWLVYRSSATPGERGHFLGRRTSPHQLLKLVHQLGACT